MNLIDIGAFIDKNEPKQFINAYLMCMAQGFSLSCPVDDNKNKLNEKWAKVLSKYRRDFSDEFCQIVSSEWFQLLSMCDLNSDDIQLQLFKASGVSLEDATIRPNQQASKKTTLQDIPKTTDHSDDPLTTPEISSSYRERQLAEAVHLPELDALTQQYKKTFSSQSSDQFLISHLSFSKYSQSKSVPKSTVPQLIREHWESIIAAEFNTIASDDFLSAITNEWFYLVNQKGIPLTHQDQEDLLITFLAKTKRPELKQKKTSTGLFKRLFGSP